MDEYFKNLILEATHATNLEEVEKIQDLWSGYGTIKRFLLTGSPINTIIVKHVNLPDNNNHPRGWNTDFSHKRKLRSYEVEKAWYRKWSDRCDDSCRVAKNYVIKTRRNETIMVFEDLDAVGFERRKAACLPSEMSPCLEWLANFHSTFLGEHPDNLWKVGTYWHLDTRPDELSALKDKKLKEASSVIDQKLRNCKYQTFVHGDAKLANFCFSEDGKDVAAVDFQYVGGGCGMKDVAYFIGSCLSENQCEQWEKKILTTYFDYLDSSIKKRGVDIDVAELIDEWRSLFHVAWADFHRFIKGWSPGHWKINSYSEKVSRKVLESL